MKEYKKAQMVAKNLPTGSYAAGCPANAPCKIFHGYRCKKCERSE